MIIHRKVIQSLGKKKKTKIRSNYKNVGNYKFKVRYDFDSLEEMMEQRKYLLSLGWEVRHETLKTVFVLRGYYDVADDPEGRKVKGREFREYHDRQYVGIIQPEILNQKESFNGRDKNVQNVRKGTEGKTGKVLLGTVRK